MYVSAKDPEAGKGSGENCANCYDFLGLKSHNVAMPGGKCFICSSPSASAYRSMII